MRDLFEFNGFSMTESMAFGLDATMGIGFFDKSSKFGDFTVPGVPYFIGGKQGTITPDSLACKVLGITLKSQEFTSADKAWQESKILIDKDKPLILKVDIGYLPYYNFLEEFHFGGHAIVLAGYDEEKGVAFVGDTVYKDLQEVPIEVLKTARSSTKGSSYMRPKNIQFSMERRPDGKRPPLAAGVKLAIQKVVSNMLRPSMNFLGIQGLKLFASSLLKWPESLKGEVENPYGGKKAPLARLMFELTHGYIETWGTGGAAFRNLYQKFLEELLILPELKEDPRAWTKEEFKIVEESVPLIKSSATNWTLLANTLKNADDEYKAECISHVNFEEMHDLALDIVGKEEEAFKKLSKIKN